MYVAESSYWKSHRRAATMGRIGSSAHGNDRAMASQESDELKVKPSGRDPATEIQSEDAAAASVELFIPTHVLRARNFI